MWVVVGTGASLVGNLMSEVGTGVRVRADEIEAGMRRGADGTPLTWA